VSTHSPFDASGFQDSLFAAGLEQVTAMEFAPDGRLFVAEKDAGNIRVIKRNDDGTGKLLHESRLAKPGGVLTSIFASIALRMGRKRHLVIPARRGPSA
jgi:glucose/arabinose dehydrogenase